MFKHKAPGILMISGVFYYWDKAIYSNLNRIMIT